MYLQIKDIINIFCKNPYTEQNFDKLGLYEAYSEENQLGFHWFTFLEKHQQQNNLETLTLDFPFPH